MRCNFFRTLVYMNIGHSSLLIYDECAYNDKLKESTDPLLYKLNPNQIHNCKQCISTLGPRTQHNGNEISTTAGHPVATAQYLTDVESILSNRNVPANKCKNGEMNPIDVTKFGLQHLGHCDTYLDPMASHLSYPPATYRELPINRFYNLNQNPQVPIFWDFATNTRLETKDNFVYNLNSVKITDPSRPHEFK